MAGAEMAVGEFGVVEEEIEAVEDGGGRHGFMVRRGCGG